MGLLTQAVETRSLRGEDTVKGLASPQPPLPAPHPHPHRRGLIPQGWQQGVSPWSGPQAQPSSGWTGRASQSLPQPAVPPSTPREFPGQLAGPGPGGSVVAHQGRAQAKAAEAPCARALSHTGSQGPLQGLSAQPLPYCVPQRARESSKATQPEQKLHTGTGWRLPLCSLTHALKAPVCLPSPCHPRHITHTPCPAPLAHSQLCPDHTCASACPALAFCRLPPHPLPPGRLSLQHPARFSLLQKTFLDP